jgi:hypothetical protein
MSFSVGPRREVVLEIVLDPVWNKAAGNMVRIRFGAIKNFEVVKEFFDGIPSRRSDDALLATIDSLKLVHRNPNHFSLSLDRFGRVVIEASHIAEDINSPCLRGENV